MGSSFDSWTDIVAEGGAYYPGVGSMEIVWVGLSIVMCVAALYIGGKHESDAYKKVGGDS